MFAAILLVLVAGCSHAPSSLNDTFEAQDGPGLDTLHLVEAPPGHLAGSLVYSSFDPKTGILNHDVDHDVSGSLYEGNVSLRMGGDLLGTNLTGHFDGQSLVLSFGNQTLVFRRVSSRQSEEDLAALRQRGQRISEVQEAIVSMRQIASDAQRLTSDLKQYVAWGQQRVSHMPKIQAWYAQQVNFYTRCLDTIRPLAQRHVPSYQWQSCVLTIDNDAYSRQQQRDELASMHDQNGKEVARLNAQIAQAPQWLNRLMANLDLMAQSCSQSKDPETCQQKFKQLDAQKPTSLLDATVVDAYRTMVSQVTNALARDAEVISTEDSKLRSLTTQVDKTYHEAN